MLLILRQIFLCDRRHNIDGMLLKEIWVVRPTNFYSLHSKPGQRQFDCETLTQLRESPWKRASAQNPYGKRDRIINVRQANRNFARSRSSGQVVDDWRWNVLTATQHENRILSDLRFSEDFVLSPNGGAVSEFGS